MRGQVVARVACGTAQGTPQRPAANQHYTQLLTLCVPNPSHLAPPQAPHPLYPSPLPPHSPPPFHFRYADGLKGPWTRHPGSPVRSWVQGSRLAGRPVRVDGQLYRFGQECEYTYGYKVGERVRRGGGGGAGWGRGKGKQGGGWGREQELRGTAQAQAPGTGGEGEHGSRELRQCPTSHASVLVGKAGHNTIMVSLSFCT